MIVFDILHCRLGAVGQLNVNFLSNSFVTDGAVLGTGKICLCGFQRLDGVCEALFKSRREGTPLSIGKMGSMTYNPIRML